MCCADSRLCYARRFGNLWAFSTAKLESRGKRMKKLARNQTSNRNMSTIAKTIVKTKRRGGVKSKHRKAGSTTYTVAGYAGNKCLAMLGRTTLREDNLMNSECAHRKREQLFTLGKLATKCTVKQDLCSARERWGDRIPSDVEFSVSQLLAATCTGKVKPLYSKDGKCQAPPVAL